MWRTAGAAPSRRSVSRIRAADRISAVGPRTAVRSAQRMNSCTLFGVVGIGEQSGDARGDGVTLVHSGGLAVDAPIARTSARTSSFTGREG